MSKSVATRQKKAGTPGWAVLLKHVQAQNKRNPRPSLVAIADAANKPFMRKRTGWKTTPSDVSSIEHKLGIGRILASRSFKAAPRPAQSEDVNNKEPYLALATAAVQVAMEAMMRMR